ncbi:hypothetical protein N7495_005753 [Penicillium taxi]|uniref:uncharacterized protein n=1 Tax=Penicillium taxi TaxID=168475 RepID=UPI0025450F00|nr:uncharacterized protein N7495_005753 [Penicillium taxi]KAJ5894062.1 hypothetical protein N7495_005753 [Penicillium taxi]
MDSSPFLDRYQQLSLLDQQKNQLIEELLQRVTDLETSFQREKLDHERETRFNRDIQLHEMELMQQISQIKTIMDREPFVVVLLDGEGIIFKDEFLQLGEEGGRNAAKQLFSSLHSYLLANFPSINTPKIITKIYINLKNLVELCTRSGIVPEPVVIYDFIRGFNETMPLFEIVDIGSSKNKAYDKVYETFQIFLYNCHCHQIFLGCASNSEYAHFLDETMEDGDLSGRISLLEGVTFDKDLETAKSTYRTAKFPEVFRTTKLAPSWIAPWKSTLPSRALMTPSPSQQFQTPPPPLSRTSTNTSTSGTGTGTGATLPAAVKLTDASPDFQVVRSKVSGSLPHKAVERNKYGQRVDRLDFKSIPRDDLNRLKKLKLCNYHFLLGECPNEENCYHDHDRKLTRQELHILSAIARMTPCRFGLECDDPDCIYGHRCPQSEPGKKTCFRGDTCRFEPVAHGIDTNIVKVTKI